ncbi:MAG: DUF1926 domain-containing protein, partial [Nitrospirae bacterium]|nr:DUF1926 domain-containing protein [Nitrospirota bacterium]
VADKDLPIRNRGVHKGIKEFYLKDEFLNLRIGYNFDDEIELWHYPVETISLSEQGVERIYQGTAFLFVKKLYLDDSHKSGFTISLGENNK